MSARQVRDWEPGDGLTCRFAKQAPRDLPCGPPVKTLIQQVSQVRSGPRSVSSPLCSQHASSEAGGPTPGQVRMKAERAARERLIRENWETYQQYMAEAIEAAALSNVVNLPNATGGA